MNTNRTDMAIEEFGEVKRREEVDIHAGVYIREVKQDGCGRCMADPIIL